MLLNKLKGLTQTQRRILFLSSILSLILMLIIIQLFRLTILSDNKNDDEIQHIRTNSKAIRGKIFDRRGILLATSEERCRIFANPQILFKKTSNLDKEVKNKIDLLSKILNIPRINILQKLKTKKTFVYLAKNLPIEIGKQINKKKIRGIGIEKEYKRIYPNKELFSHVLGFCGYSHEGREGIEYKYNEILQPSIVNKNANINDRYGKSLQLSLDSVLQKIVEKRLKEGVKSFKANSGSIIVADVYTGEILSLANYPGYEPAKFKEYPSKSFKNVAITDVYEAGSVFKIFAATMLLEEEKVSEFTPINCKGSIEINGRYMHCPRSHGAITFQDAIKYSCNVGIIQSSIQIEKERFYYYLKKFGFGTKTGIDLNGESKGIVLPLKRMTLQSRAMMSIGYEISVTPIQIVTAFSAIANGGFLLKPRVVKKIINEDGSLYKKTSIKYKKQKKIITKNTGNRIIKMMERVLEKGGTGYEAFHRSLNLAGKTGTAQVFNNKTQQYEVDEVNASFLGLLPTENTKLVILVIIRKPKAYSAAAKVAVPIFSQIVDDVLNNGLIYDY